MAKSRPRPAAAPETDKRALIASALLDGADDTAILERLLAAGVSEPSARYEVARLPRDPIAMAARTLAARLAKRDWALANRGKLASMDAVPVVHAIDRETFYRDHYRANLPVKLTGLVDHWPALSRWSLDHFAAIAADAMVEAQAGRETNSEYEVAKDAHRRHLRFAELIEWLRADRASNDIYLTAYNSGANGAALAALWDDLAPIGILDQPARRDGFFWLGPRGTLTPFHHDLTNNLLVQVIGRKRVKLVPSWEIGRMRNHLHCFSAWEDEALPAGPDDADRPPVLECEIGPGDALFLPVGWWHHVEALDLSASMSFTSFAGDNDFSRHYRSYGAM